MSTAVDGTEPRPTGPPQARAQDRDGCSPGQARSSEQAQALADFTRSIAVVESAGRVESGLAQTLRALAADDHSEAATRRLRLAEDAARGAQVAGKITENLQQHASRRAEHADEVALRQGLDHVARVVAELARAEHEVAGTFTDLAGRNGPDRAARYRQLAAAASAAAQRARGLAQTLHRLAQEDADKTSPDGTPVAGPVEERRAVSSVHPRLAEIEQRLAELRQARLTMPGDDPGPWEGPDPLRRTRLAHQHWQESVAHLLESRQLAADAFGRAASAHDRAAEANARSARAGIGDVAEHRRMALLHEAAANADRQQAEKIRDQARDQPLTSDTDVSA